MRTIEVLRLERIGDELCLVFKHDDSRFKGILGKIDPAKLDALVHAFSEAASVYRRRNGPDFKVSLLS